MIRRANIEDIELIQSIIKDKSIYPYIIDDNSPACEDVKVILDTGHCPVTWLCL